MAIRGFENRLSVREQVQFRQPRSAEPHPFRGRCLAIEIKERAGRLRRAESLFVERDGQMRFNLRAPILAVGGLTVRVITPGGNEIKLDRLNGMTPEEIDQFADEIDASMGITVYRPGELILPRMVVVSPGLTENRLWVTQTEVTIAMFRQYAALTGYKPRSTTWNLDVNSGSFISLLLDSEDGAQALTFVSFHEARTYARWFSEVTGRPFRLERKGECSTGGRVGRYLTEAVNLWVAPRGHIADRVNGGFYQKPMHYRLPNVGFRMVEDKRKR